MNQIGAGARGASACFPVEQSEDARREHRVERHQQEGPLASEVDRKPERRRQQQRGRDQRRVADEHGGEPEHDKRGNHERGEQERRLDPAKVVFRDECDSQPDLRRRQAGKANEEEHALPQREKYESDPEPRRALQRTERGRRASCDEDTWLESIRRTLPRPDGPLLSATDRIVP